MLFQKNALFDSFTCEENLLFPLKERKGIVGAEARDARAQFLEAVGLKGTQNLYPDEISGGMQKRLGIARALIVEPEIILYDEPTAGLDPITSRTIADLIRELARKPAAPCSPSPTTCSAPTSSATASACSRRASSSTAARRPRSQSHADPAIRQFIYGLKEGPLDVRELSGESMPDPLRERQQVVRPEDDSRDVSLRSRAQARSSSSWARAAWASPSRSSTSWACSSPTQGRVLTSTARRHAAGRRPSWPDVRRKCGMVFQHPALLDSLTSTRTWRFGLRTPQYMPTLGADPDRSRDPRVVVEKLALVQPGRGRPRPHAAGDLLRDAEARFAGAHPRAGPAYLLFDEPTTGLDPITTNAVNDLIFELSRKLKVTSVVVSHDMACALKIADRILVLDQGGILALGNAWPRSSAPRSP